MALSSICNAQQLSYTTEEFNFPNKKHETERRTALTHYLGQITEKQMVGFCFESSIFCFDIVRL